MLLLDALFCFSLSLLPSSRLGSSFAFVPQLPLRSAALPQLPSYTTSSSISVTPAIFSYLQTPLILLLYSFWTEGFFLCFHFNVRSFAAWILDLCPEASSTTWRVTQSLIYSILSRVKILFFIYVYKHRYTYICISIRKRGCIYV